MDMGKAPRLAGTAWVLSLASFLLVSATAAAPPGLLERYGDGGRHFAEVEIGYMLVYYHQRALGQATVEKDYIVYQLDRETGKLLARKSHWRDDLPATMPDLRVSRDQAEAIVEGEVDFSNLYIISPESDVFPLDPTPRNPCWAVRSVGERGEYVVTVIDAVTGLVLGEGVPPPYTAFSLTGPQYDGPCSGAWDAWSEQAAYWFDQMGYSTEVVEWPTESKVRSHIQSDTTAMFYELAHGGSYDFASGCSGGSSYEFTYSGEIQTWIMDYEKMPFAFIGSCDGMCYTNNGTFAYVFRKGSSVGATVVGYCGMSEPQCADCWAYSRNWQGVLFNYMDQGYTVKDAFDQADADYPVCATPNCTRFAGDEDFTVVPIVYRVPDTDPGDCNHDFQVNLSDWAQFSGCLSGPVAPYVGDCECADFDGDTDADLADFAQYQTTYVYPLPPVVFVDASATGGNNGSSWTDAFTELQAALGVAVEGDEVWVAAGRYTPDYDVGTGVHTGSRDAAFLATAGVGIYGGFAGGEVYKHHRDLAANATILSGDLAGNDGPGFANNGENSYHVVTVSASGFGYPPVIDGCTIAGGNADGSWPDNAGGGVFNESQEIVLRACIVRSNAAFLLGGGLFQYNLADCTLVNCVFTGNTADDGGAVYSDLQSVTVINSSFSGNTAGDRAGGVYCGGGGLTVSGSIFWGNTAISGSTEDAQIYVPVGTVDVNYSCVEGWTGDLGGTGNIGANPAFADADGADDQFGTDDDDLRLLAGSPGIDAGDNAAMPGGVVTDLDSNPRFVDDPSTGDTGNGSAPVVDMGAYEFQ